MSSFDDFLSMMDATHILASTESREKTVCYDAVDAMDARNLLKPLLPPYRAIPPYALKCKVASIASIPSTGDEHDQAERAAIQWESEQPPDPDPTGTAGVPGFEGMPDLTPAQHGVILKRLMGHRP